MSEKTLPDLLRELALARQEYAVLTAQYDAAKAAFDSEYEALLTAIARAHDTIKWREADIRELAQPIAEATDAPPCPGLKVRHETVVSYEVPEPHTPFDKDAINELLVHYAVEHQWLSALTADRALVEKVLKAQPKEDLPPWARIVRRTVVTIDRDLRPLLATEEPDASDRQYTRE
jgi:hypothetical protein